MTWVLVLFLHAGMLSEKDSMALTNVPGFADRKQCEAAGRASVEAFGTGTKRAAYVCVEQKRA